jgi:hypothetical protein
MPAASLPETGRGQQAIQRPAAVLGLPVRTFYDDGAAGKHRKASESLTLWGALDSEQDGLPHC